MRELLRSPDGTINRGEFRRGAAFLVAITGACLLLLTGIFRLSHDMAWMTVMIAPFFGMIVFLIVCSLLYFWYCLFIKRLRAMGQPTLFPLAWLVTVALCGTGYLIDYQNRTLGLATDGLLVHAGEIGKLLAFVAALFFIIQFGACWFGPDRDVGTGECFPERGKPKNG
jgi:uncharacterized membrane protein YhaH (DUF805 family)